MLTFARYLDLDEGRFQVPDDWYKGWMSPSGKAHVWKHTVTGSEHHEMLPPEMKDKMKGGDYHDVLHKMLKKGYSRFGYDGGHYVHFDKKTPAGHKSAVHAVNYMKPAQNGDVTIDSMSYNEPKHEDHSHWAVGHGAALRHIRSLAKSKS